MIRAFDSRGHLIIGIPRASLMRMLLENGHLTSSPLPGDDSGIVVHIYGGETDEHVIEKVCGHYGSVPNEIRDVREKP